MPRFPPASSTARAHRRGRKRPDAVGRLPERRGEGGESDSDWDRLPEILARPQAVLYETRRQPELLYILEPAGDAAGKGKIVARADYTDRLSLEGEPRRTTTTALIRTAGYLRPEHLRHPRYEGLNGALE